VWREDNSTGAQDSRRRGCPADRSHRARVDHSRQRRHVLPAAIKSHEGEIATKSAKNTEGGSIFLCFFALFVAMSPSWLLIAADGRPYTEERLPDLTSSEG